MSQLIRNGTGWFYALSNGWAICCRTRLRFLLFSLCYCWLLCRLAAMDYPSPIRASVWFVQLCIADDGLIHVVPACLMLTVWSKSWRIPFKISPVSAPLGTVLVSLLGSTDLRFSWVLAISALMRLLALKKSPRKLTTFMVVLTGILSNAASALGYLVLNPLSTIIFFFHSLGRHPRKLRLRLFINVSGSYSANLFARHNRSALGKAHHQRAAQIIHPDCVVSPHKQPGFMVAEYVCDCFDWLFCCWKIVRPHGGPLSIRFVTEERHSAFQWNHAFGI